MVIKSVMIYLSSGINNISGTLSKFTVNGLNLNGILKVFSYTNVRFNRFVSLLREYNSWRFVILKVFILIYYEFPFIH